jgi:hypothetical protein
VRAAARPGGCLRQIDQGFGDIDVRRETEVTVPAHAGPMRPLERCVFVLVFTLMAALAVAIPITATTSRGHLLFAGPSSATAPGAQTVALSGQQEVQGTAVLRAGSRSKSAGDVGKASGAARSGHRATASPRLDAQLAAALRPVLSGETGQLAVGVADLSTGVTATYDAGVSFRAAGIAATDILATLLLQHQRARTPVTDHEAELAADMMENSSGSAAAALWNTVGGASGIASANAALKLNHTAPAAGADWTLTMTTVSDQLRLLSDLAGAGSPLAPAARDYALGLMADGTGSQRWGVLAAAGKGSAGAVSDGSQLGWGWVVNSIGVLQRHGHELLVVVLSSHDAAPAPAVSMVQAAAVAAADVVG